MIKWADYLISSVRFEEAGSIKHVSHVKVSEDKGQEITKAEVWTKDEVIKALDDGKTFKTIVMGNNQWIEGEIVFKERITDCDHLKTKKNNINKSDLDNLPVF